MKKNTLKPLILICCALSSPLLQAMLPFLPESVKTKSEQTLQLALAETKEEIDEAVEVLQTRFSDTHHQDQFREIYASVKTPHGPQIVGAANFLVPTFFRSYLHLANIVVLEEFRSAGIGTALLDYLIRHTTCTIQLYNVDEVAIRLYKKHGFYSYDKKDPNNMRRDYNAKDSSQGITS